MHKVKLEKVESSHNNLRTNSVTGVCIELPIVGKSFMLMSDEVLTASATVRVINTSIVKDVLKCANGDLSFTTENSTYLLKTML